MSTDALRERARGTLRDWFANRLECPECGSSSVWVHGPPFRALPDTADCQNCCHRWELEGARAALASYRGEG